MHVRMCEFFSWCQQHSKIDHLENQFERLVSVAVSLTDNNDKKTCDAFSSVCNEVKDFFQQNLSQLMFEFCSEGERSPTFKFWNMFLKAVQILLYDIRAERQGIWSLHLFSKAAMLPYIFFTNRMNYSRWLPVYVLDMMEIPDEIKTIFENGEFSIRQTEGSFNGVWTDMAVEKTVIKDSKGSGGIVGLTRKKSALVRWTLTRHIMASFASSMKARAGASNDADPNHDQIRPASIKRDELHVNSLIVHLQDKMTNPFDVSCHPDALFNIATGMHATKEVQQSLLSAVPHGEKQTKTFVDSSLSEGQDRSFYAPITRSNIKTFGDMTKKNKAQK